MREDFNKISEEEFLDIIKYHQKYVREFIEDELYDYIAFYIAKGIECEAIFDNDLERIINTAIESFDSFQFRNSIDWKRVKKILREDYSIKIVKDNPMKIEIISWFY